jgi:hypothetical protein
MSSLASSYELQVIVIEPGFMRTPIIANAKQKLDDLWRALPCDAQVFNYPLIFCFHHS